jgi:hypothetical protein
MYFLSRILGNSFYGDDYLVSISRDRTTRESCCLSFTGANSPWAGTNLKAYDSLDRPVCVLFLIPIFIKKKKKKKKGGKVHINPLKLPHHCQCTPSKLLIVSISPKLPKNVNVHLMTKNTLHKIIKIK